MKKTPLDFLSEMHRVEDEIIRSILSDDLTLEDVPETLLTQKICLNAILKCEENFYQIPSRFKDELVCLMAIQLNKSILPTLTNDVGAWATKQINEPVLSFLKEKYKSKYVCKETIKLDYKNICYIPKEYLDNDYLSELIGLNPEILTELDHEYLTGQICEVAIDSEGFKLSYLPVSMRSKKYCYMAYEKSYIEILSFPKEYITYDLILDAIKKCDKSEIRGIIKLRDSNLWKDELIIEAMKKDEYVFKLIPFELITTDLMFKLAPYFMNYDVLYHTPISSFTETLNQYLVSHNAMLLGGIPEPMRNRVLCIDAVSRNGLALEFVPKKAQNEEVYNVAVQNNGLALKFVPTPYRDENLPELAVAQNGEAVEYVPITYVNEILCKNAVRNNPHAIYKIKKSFLNADLYYIAIKSLPRVLKLIPLEERTEELCYMAFKQDSSMIDYIPIQVKKMESIKNLMVKYGIEDQENFD